MDLTLKILAGIFFVTLLSLTLSLVLVFIMHILMPRNVLKIYFKEPYFGPGEIAMFTGFPASGKKRGIENAYKLAPVWYCKVSKYFIIFFVPAFALLVLLTAVLCIYICCCTNESIRIVRSGGVSVTVYIAKHSDRLLAV